MCLVDGIPLQSAPSNGSNLPKSYPSICSKHLHCYHVQMTQISCAYQCVTLQCRSVLLRVLVAGCNKKETYQPSRKSSFANFVGELHC